MVYGHGILWYKKKTRINKMIGDGRRRVDKLVQIINGCEEIVQVYLVQIESCITKPVETGSSVSFFKACA